MCSQCLTVMQCKPLRRIVNQALVNCLHCIRQSLHWTFSFISKWKMDSGSLWPIMADYGHLDTGFWRWSIIDNLHPNRSNVCFECAIAYMGSMTLTFNFKLFPPFFKLFLSFCRFSFIFTVVIPTPFVGINNKHQSHCELMISNYVSTKTYIICNDHSLDNCRYK